MIKKILLAVYMLITFFLLIVIFAGSFNEIQGDSMYPTLNNEDFVYGVKTKNVKKGDIIFVYHKEDDEIFVKRVIGTAGDEIYIGWDGLFVNGEPLTEAYINEDDWEEKFAGRRYSVGEDEVFVLGDNRNESLDSRLLGNFKKEDIRSRAVINLKKTLGINKKRFKWIKNGLLIVAVLVVLVVFYTDRKKD